MEAQADKIISALIGLVHACDSNPKTENTDLVVIRALAFTAVCPDCDDASVQGMVDEIHEEKYAIAPGCATCASPCGNTSDYDMDRIYRAGDEIRRAKLDILSELQKAAAYIYRQGSAAISPSHIELIYKTLSYVSYDLDKSVLLPLGEQVRKISQDEEKTT